MSDFLNDLQPVEEESIERILIRLMEVDGIALKTEYPNPLNVARLSTLADWLRKEEMTDSADLIDLFVKYYSQDMVSLDRKGRGEIVRALQERLRDEAEGRSRWTGKEMPEE